MNQIVEQTYEQKVQMYMNVPVGELIEMLIKAEERVDKLISNIQDIINQQNQNKP